MDFDCADPAALIARALKKKFAAQQRNCESPDACKYSDSPASSAGGDHSECWSPSPSSSSGRRKSAPVGLQLTTRYHCVSLLLLMAVIDVKR